VPTAARARCGPQLEPSIRARLVEAAADVFSEQGYERARVQDIARAAGLTTGAIYANFRDKADLLVAAIALGGDRVKREVAAAARQGRSAIELYELMARALGGTRTRGRRRLLSEALAAARRDRDVARRVRALVTGIEDELAHVVEQARADGAVAGDVDTGALVRFGLALSLGVQQLAAAGVGPPDADAWRVVVHRFVTAMSPRPASRT
jgi:AcrR family transcriptional regulator